MRDANGSAQGDAVVIFVVGRGAVAGGGAVDAAIEIVEPGVGIKICVAIDLEGCAVIAVGAGLGGVALDTAGGSSILGRDAADQDLELTGRFDRGKDFVGESVAEAFDLKAGSVEENFAAEGLATGDAALKGTAAGPSAVGRGSEEGSAIRNSQDRRRSQSEPEGRRR